MTKPCTNALQPSNTSIIQMFLILSRFNIAILHLLVVCIFIDSVTSKYAPRYFITLLLSILVPVTFRLSDIHMASCYLDPSRANSIFPSLIFGMLMSLQVLMFLATFKDIQLLPFLYSYIHAILL